MRTKDVDGSQNSQGSFSVYDFVTEESSDDSNFFPPSADLDDSSPEFLLYTLMASFWSSMSDADKTLPWSVGLKI